MIARFYKRYRSGRTSRTKLATAGRALPNFLWAVQSVNSHVAKDFVDFLRHGQVSSSGSLTSSDGVTSDSIVSKTSKCNRQPAEEAARDGHIRPPIMRLPID
jgi:hypothetical protein